jgi:hypothetical protein
MKPLKPKKMTKDQLTAIVQYTIDVEQHQGGASINPDKHLSFQVLELTTCFKVEFTWIAEIQTVGRDEERENRNIGAETFFKLEPKENNNVLYAKIMNCLTEVEKTALIYN